MHTWVSSLHFPHGGVGTGVSHLAYFYHLVHCWTICVLMKINIRLKQLSLQSTLVKPPQIYDSSLWGPPRSSPTSTGKGGTLMEGGNPWQHKQEQKPRGQPSVLGLDSWDVCRKPVLLNLPLLIGDTSTPPQAHAFLLNPHASAWRQLIYQPAVPSVRSCWTSHWIQAKDPDALLKTKCVKTASQTSSMSKKDRVVQASSHPFNSSGWLICCSLCFNSMSADELNTNDPTHSWRNVSKLLIFTKQLKQFNPQS